VHGIKPGNIVGAIANEAGIEGVHIGRVDIREDHSFVDLPEGMPDRIFKDLQKVRVVGRELRINRVDEKPPKAPRDTAGRHPPGRHPAGRSAVGRKPDAPPRKMLSRRKAKN
jgi:ATP-dependent RNA helicase DeaD